MNIIIGKARPLSGHLAEAHPQVLIIAPGHLDDAQACTPRRADALDADGIAAEAADVQAAGGRYVDLSALFCTDRACPVIVGDDLVFRDDNHVTTTYARALEPALATLIS